MYESFRTSAHHGGNCKVVGACDHMFDLRYPLCRSVKVTERSRRSIETPRIHTGCVVKYLTDHQYSAAGCDGLYDGRVTTGYCVYVRVCGRIKQHLDYLIERTTT